MSDSDLSRLVSLCNKFIAFYELHLLRKIKRHENQQISVGSYMAWAYAKIVYAQLVSLNNRQLSSFPDTRVDDLYRTLDEAIAIVDDWIPASSETSASSHRPNSSTASVNDVNLEIPYVLHSYFKGWFDVLSPYVEQTLRLNMNRVPVEDHQRQIMPGNYYLASSGATGLFVYQPEKESLRISPGYVISQNDKIVRLTSRFSGQPASSKIRVVSNLEDKLLTQGIILDVDFTIVKQILGISKPESNQNLHVAQQPVNDSRPSQVPARILNQPVPLARQSTSPIKQPVMQPVMQPVIQPVIQPVMQRPTSPIKQPVIHQPVMQRPTSPIKQPVIQPVIQPVMQPVIHQPVIHQPVIQQPVIKQPVIQKSRPPMAHKPLPMPPVVHKPLPVPAVVQQPMSSVVAQPLTHKPLPVPPVVQRPKSFIDFDLDSKPRTVSSSLTQPLVDNSANSSTVPNAFAVNSLTQASLNDANINSHRVVNASARGEAKPISSTTNNILPGTMRSPKEANFPKTLYTEPSQTPDVGPPKTSYLDSPDSFKTPEDWNEHEQTTANNLSTVKDSARVETPKTPKVNPGRRRWIDVRPLANWFIGQPTGPISPIFRTPADEENNSGDEQNSADEENNSGDEQNSADDEENSADDEQNSADDEESNSVDDEENSADEEELEIQPRRRFLGLF